GFIDEPDKIWSQDELPPITNSFGVEDVKKRVLQLNKIAINLRKQRFDNGALRLDQSGVDEELCENLGLEVDAGTSMAACSQITSSHSAHFQANAECQVFLFWITSRTPPFIYHYALNVPLYTHFTSPIRRYPDILVHRLLAASLGYCDPPEKSPQLLHRQADYCNDKKLNAKIASKRSNDMYFALFVKEAGPLEEMGMVMAVLDKSFDVLILKLGVVKRVYLERLPLRSHKFRKNHKCPELEIEWVADEKCNHRTRHLISLFTMVECMVFADKEPLRWSCLIKRPKEEIKFITTDE
ncbi:hypothetical protein RRG08_066473, partial [Elysia crispata]